MSDTGVDLSASYGTDTEFTGGEARMSEGESLLSVLFSGVSGSVKLYEKLGDAEAARAVDRCLKRIERSVESFHGRVVKNAGDEVMAVFETTDDAFHAAIDMQQRVAHLPPVSGVKLAIRVGFHHGQVIENDGRFDGPSVNVAARLAGLAKGGQILISAQTQQLLTPLLPLSTQGLDQVSVKGDGDELQVFEVSWQESEALAPIRSVSAITEAHGQSARLCVRYAGNVIVLDEKNSSISFGRDAACNVVVHDRRASRKHAKIERRGEKFVLSDQSTNGTFLTLGNEPEVILRREEVVLHGSGIICFAASAISPKADFAEFEYL